MKCFLLALCAIPLLAQVDGPITSPSGGPPPIAYTQLLFYDGNGNLQYACSARSLQPSHSVTITNVTVNANTGTVNATAHGLQVGNSITLAGSATAALNGAYIIATVPGANSFTITTSGVSNAAYTDATMTTTAPQSSSAVWSIEKLTYTNNNLSLMQWASGSTALNQICDNRTALAYQ